MVKMMREMVVPSAHKSTGKETSVVGWPEVPQYWPCILPLCFPIAPLQGFLAGTGGPSDWRRGGGGLTGGGAGGTKFLNKLIDLNMNEHELPKYIESKKKKFDSHIFGNSCSFKTPRGSKLSSTMFSEKHSYRENLRKQLTHRFELPKFFPKFGSTVWTLIPLTVKISRASTITLRCSLLFCHSYAQDHRVVHPGNHRECTPKITG